MFTQSSTGIISFTAPFSPGRLCVVPVCNIAGANPFGITICIFGSSVVIVVSLSAKPLPSTLGVSSGPPPDLLLFHLVFFLKFYLYTLIHHFHYLLHLDIHLLPLAIYLIFLH